MHGSNWWACCGRCRCFQTAQIAQGAGGKCPTYFLIVAPFWKHNIIKTYVWRMDDFSVTPKRHRRDFPPCLRLQAGGISDLDRHCDTPLRLPIFIYLCTVQWILTSKRLWNGNLAFEKRCKRNHIDHLLLLPCWIMETSLPVKHCLFIIVWYLYFGSR